MEKGKDGFVGVLLAGGESRRFGQPKAFVKWQGKTFFERALEALQSNVSDLVIVSHPSLLEQFQAMEIEVVCDRKDVQGKGPLAGILTAMDKQASQWYCILPCDMPLINKEIIKVLKKVAAKNSDYGAIIPIVDGKIQPLVGVYHIRCKSLIEEMLKNNIHKVAELLDQLHVLYIEQADLGIEAHVFKNVNTIKDLKGMLSNKNEDL